MITGMPRIAIAANDFDKITSTFRDQLGMPVIDFSESSVESLGAKLAMCVPTHGSNIELMSPAVEDAPLSQSLRRFLDHRGEGLFALMLEAPEPDEEAQRLIANGLNVLPLMQGAGGRDIHPNSVHGVLIRIYPVNSFQGVMEEPDDSMALSGIQRVVIAVRDLTASNETYRDKLGLAAQAPNKDVERGVNSVLVYPPSGGMIELVSSADRRRPYADRIAKMIEDRGEGMFELVLKTSDLGRAHETMSERGLTVDMSDDALLISKTDTHGVQIRIETV